MIFFEFEAKARKERIVAGGKRRDFNLLEKGIIRRDDLLASQAAEYRTEVQESC